MDPERLYVELRAAEGRTIEGVAIRYGDTANIGRLRERFEAGSIEVREPAIVNLGHDRAQPLGIVAFRDTADALTFAATLPDGPRQDAALADVREGRLTGASIEFRAVRERMVGTLRIIDRAHVVGVALTDRPAYPDTAVEAREALLPAPDEGDERRRLLWT